MASHKGHKGHDVVHTEGKVKEFQISDLRLQIWLLWQERYFFTAENAESTERSRNL